MEVILSFLEKLRDNNNREWFAEHRAEYEEYREHLNALAEKLIAAVAKVNPEYARLTPADCTYRIHRDLRFSEDKTPYKTHAGIFINTRGKKSLTLGHYLHIEPGNVLYAAGTICLPSKVITAIRTAIRDGIEEYVEIVEDPAYKKLFKMTGSNPVKTAPKGFDRDWEYIDLVRPKDFCIEAPLRKSLYMSPDLPKKLLPYLRQGERYIAFHNYTVEDFV